MSDLPQPSSHGEGSGAQQGVLHEVGDQVHTQSRGKGSK